MNGWLGLIQQGPSPCEKRQASLGAPTAGVTGKGGTWRTKPPDAESAVWGRFPARAGNAPHLSSARGVGPVFACQEP